MKKQIFSIFLLAVMLIGTSVIQAQEDTKSERGAISKGKHMIMVTGGFSSVDDDDGSDRITEINVNLDYRLFVLKGLSVGLDVTQEVLIQASDIQDSYVRQFVRLGPEVAYFFGKPDRAVIPFVSVTFGFISLTDNSALSNDAITGNRYNFGGGVLFNSSNRIGGVMQLSFQEDIFREGSQKYKLNELALTMGISISLY